MALKKDIKVRIGQLVIPKHEEFVLLTPEEVARALEIESWIEWSAGQPGIVLSTSHDETSVAVITPRGIGTCFIDEIVKL